MCRQPAFLLTGVFLMAYQIKGNASIVRDLDVGRDVTVAGVKFRTFHTIIEAETATGADEQVAYITELAGWFQYDADSAAVVDHTTILATGDGGTTRWVVTAAAGGTAEPTYTNPLPSAITVGGIAAGTTFSNRTITQMFDDMLYPELFPSLTNPSSGFTSSVTGLREIGEVLGTITFSSTFSRGSISPAYGTSGFRSGLPSQYDFTGSGIPANEASTSLSNTQTATSYTVVSGAQSWTGRVTYSAGEQPLSSKGNNFNSPLAGGQTSAITRTITGVYPWFATSVEMVTLTKQALAAHNASYFEVSMSAESGSDKQTADFPTVFSAITGIQFYNSVSSAWEWIGGSKANSLLTFTTSATTQTVQGSVINYTKYAHNGSTIGARQLRFYTT